MERIDCLVFGYRIFLIEAEDIPLVSTLMLRAGITVRISACGFSVRERDVSRLKSLLDGRIEYKISELCGIPGHISAFLFKKGAAVGIAISLILLLLSSVLVWDVRVEGNESLPDTVIAYALSEQGLSVGSLWLGLHRSEVESAVLSEYPELSWININRRGNVAYVTVSEKSGTDQDEPAVGYSNLVASCDCVIEEITVTSGVAAVKPGDAVKKGDLLISGVMPESAGGGFCYANGVIVGRISDRVSVEVAREYGKIISERRFCTEITLKIFNFSVNIFKRYGNYTYECDIIKEIRVFSLPGGVSLPLAVSSAYVTETQTKSRLYSDAELVRICSARLASRMVSRTVGAELIRIRTFGDYTDFGYEMYSDIVLLADVGENLPFETEE